MKLIREKDEDAADSLTLLTGFDGCRSSRSMFDNDQVRNAANPSPFGYHHGESASKWTEHTPTLQDYLQQQPRLDSTQ